MLIYSVVRVWLAHMPAHSSMPIKLTPDCPSAQMGSISQAGSHQPRKFPLAHKHNSYKGCDFTPASVTSMIKHLVLRHRDSGRNSSLLNPSKVVTLFLYAKYVHKYLPK
jgi:hypothetical protein